MHRAIWAGRYNFERYQPAGRFWEFQAVETLLFVVMAAGLLLAAGWWVRRRLT